MFEIELKFPVPNPDGLRKRLSDRGAVCLGSHTNADTYFEHPSREFRQTGEALRIRLEDGVPSVTYKSAKRPVTGADTISFGAPIAKARRELEWRLDPGDADGAKMHLLLTSLGFQPVACVQKQRETYQIVLDDTPVTITIDDVSGVGQFAEIELVLSSADPSDEAVGQARAQLAAIAGLLQLSNPEKRSYLRMWLDAQSGDGSS